MVDLQIGSGSTDADEWATIPKIQKKKCRQGTTCYERDTELSIVDTSTFYYQNALALGQNPVTYLKEGELKFEILPGLVGCTIKFS